MQDYMYEREKFFRENQGTEIKKDMIHIENKEGYTALSWTAIKYISPLLKTWGIKHAVYEKKDLTKDMPRTCVSGFQKQSYFVVVRSKVKKEDLEFLQDLLHRHEYRRKIEEACDPKYILETMVRTATEEEVVKLENELC